MESKKLDVRHIGDTDHKGSYWFYDPDKLGWIVVDLDTWRCGLHGELVIVHCERSSDAHDHLEMVTRGQEGETFLLDMADYALIDRDYTGQLHILTVYGQDGLVKPGPKFKK